MSPNRGGQPDFRSASLPEIGQPFNPYKRFKGSFIPEQICRYRGLSTGAKLVYGRLCRYAGEDGATYPSTAALADEVGLGETQVRTYIKELERKRFLKVDRQNRRYRPDGSGGSNQYTFLFHEAFIGAAGDPRKAPPPLRRSERAPLQKTEGVPLRKTAPLTGSENRSQRESVLSRESIKKGQSNPDDRFGRSENSDPQPPQGWRATSGDSNDQPAGPKALASEAHQYSGEERKQLSEAIGLYGQRRRMRDHMGQETPSVIVQKSLDSADGASIDEIVQILRNRCLRGYEPGTTRGPRCWGWFPAVIAEAIQSSRQYQAATQEEAVPHGETPSAQGAPVKLNSLWTRNHVLSRAERLRSLGGYEDIASEMERMVSDEEGHRDLENIEERLTTLEEKMIAVAYSQQSEADRSKISKAINSQLDAYRGKMSQVQLRVLEHQYLTRHVIECAGLPRLSLFYAGGDLERAA